MGVAGQPAFYRIDLLIGPPAESLVDISISLDP